MELSFRENDLVVKISVLQNSVSLFFLEIQIFSVPKRITMQMYEFLEFFPASLQNLKPTPLQRFPGDISQHFVALLFIGLPVSLHGFVWTPVGVLVRLIKQTNDGNSLLLRKASL